ncbi:MAG: spore coat protein [Oscillospiraceae bacterium]|jgi:rubrerythrin|nr:spore coat protein [Oscillospiraceae bacterium]
MANLTTKELSALEDQIGQEKTLVKKYQSMAQMATDSAISQSLNEFAQKHQQHVTTLMSFFN